jgi:hypothetical protein
MLNYLRKLCEGKQEFLNESDAQADPDEVMSLRGEGRPARDGEPHAATQQRLDLVKDNAVHNVGLLSGPCPVQLVPAT